MSWGSPPIEAVARGATWQRSGCRLGGDLDCGVRGGFSVCVRMIWEGDGGCHMALLCSGCE